MIVRPEIALVLGAIAFYLYDAALLLYADEVLFFHGRRGWRAWPGPGFMLGGRFLCLPRPFAPATPVFRHGWSQPAPCRPGRRPPMAPFLRALRPLQYGSALLAALLFVALPACVLWWRDPRATLALAVALYGTALAVTAYLVRRRRVLGLHGRSLALLALDTLACPPFAVNVARRVALLRGPGREARRFAQRVLPPEACAAAGAAVAARLTDGAGPDREGAG